MRLIRTLTTGAAVVALGLGLTACGAPATSIEDSGTYEVGDDIVAGNWAITAPKGTRADPCRFSVWSGDTQIGSSATIAAGGSGIPLRDGQTLITIGCGTWSKVS